MLEVNKAQLDARMKQLGIESYAALSEYAKSRGVSLAFSTVYQLADGGNWRRSTLEALCQVLECKPSDLIPGLTDCGSDRYTHASPQPVQESQTAGV